MEEGAFMAVQHQYDDDQTDAFTINIAPELRRRIRVAAAQSNLPVQEYVGQILEEVVPPVTNPQKRSRGLNPEAVERLLQTREAIRRAHPEQVFEDSSELIHQAHEERARELEQR